MNRYNLKKFYKRVADYKKLLKHIKGKSILFTINLNQKAAFYSLAPLSKAIDELGGDIFVEIAKNKSKNLEVIKDIWTCYNNSSHGLKDKKTKSLRAFLNLANKKCKGNLENIFKPADLYFNATNNGFEGSFFIPYSISWMSEYNQKLLLKTAKVIWSQVYNLKKIEKVKINFELLKKDSELGLPIEDYLDSFQISYAMMLAVISHEVTMTASSSRSSQLDKPEPISDLKATILGCELCKDVNEPIFKKFKVLSKLLKINRLQIPSAVFSIHGKGYSGKHYFGEYIGYSSKNKKTRWLSPAQMLYKLDYYPQSALDTREPKSRIAFTETLPIDIFIKTCNIDWLAMHKRNLKIKKIAQKCQYLLVKGKKFGKYQTNLKVNLISRQGNLRRIKGSDVSTRTLINQDYYKLTGIKAGNMANLPGGEVFTTPESIEGQFIGDVVISIDQSYILNRNNFLIVNCFGNNYKILSGPKKILMKFNQKKRQAWQKLIQHEKSNSIPADIIKINKENFNNIGEFAINTNPKAELCNYLIVNEKIANMIHIALGSGFEPDRATYYHTDIVIDSPRQELDIYGVDKHNKKYWIHKKGKFVV